MAAWPTVLDDFPGDPLPDDDKNVLKAVWESGSLSVFNCTWNMHGKPGPDDLSPLLPPGRCHIYAIGTEECERSIASSVVFTSKDRWESQIKVCLGGHYTLVASQTLAAIHLAVFVHRALLPVLSDVQHSFVPCGFGNAIGNKGAVGISFNIGKTAMLFMNAHLAAHQKRVGDRNRDYSRIESVMPLVPVGYGLEAKLAAEAGLLSIVNSKSETAATSGVMGYAETDEDSDDDDEEEVEQPLSGPTSQPSELHIRTSQISPPSPASNGAGVVDLADLVAVPSTVSARFDRVFFMGDFNYRIDADRATVDAWIRENNHAALLQRDQLRAQQATGATFMDYKEPALNFKPTYKYDKGTDSYDTSEKQRIPAWTDRILYKSNDEMAIIPKIYKSIDELKTSDHRPVVGIFVVKLRGAARKPTTVTSGMAATSLASPIASPPAARLQGSPPLLVSHGTPATCCFLSPKRSNKVAPAPPGSLT